MCMLSAVFRPQSYSRRGVEVLKWTTILLFLFTFLPKIAILAKTLIISQLFTDNNFKFNYLFVYTV